MISPSSNALANGGTAKKDSASSHLKMVAQMYLFTNRQFKPMDSEA